jgi:hypothetical protein
MSNPIHSDPAEHNLLLRFFYRDCLQPGQPVASPDAAEENRRLVADELATAVGEDGRTAGQARPLLLVVAGRGTPAPAAVWPDAPANLGAASAERVAPHCGCKF